MLESPSVLKPTYDFVKASKAKAGENVSGWSFLDWRENSLEVKLEKGTSVLNISYRDTDPDIVLPVIEKISHDYQQYSGRDRQRGIRNGISYLEKQISEIRKQSFKSMRQAQSYGLANGLGLQDGLPGVSKAAGDISGSTSLESRRDTAQIRVNALEQQLKTARSTINRSVFQAAQLDANTQLFKELQGLETLLLEKQALLKPTDDLIRQITRRRQNLITYINQQTIGLLEGQLVTAKSRLASLSRPHEVILKHRELVRTAMLDEKVLVELEAQLQNLQLEQARQTDPWELISTPTLLDAPVAPRKARIVALGFLGGLVLGCGAALFQDRRSDLIFNEEELISLLPCPLLKHLPSTAVDTWSDAADLLVSGPISEAPTDGGIALIPLGKIPSEQLKYLSDELKRALKGRELLISTDLRKTGSCATQILVTTPGAITRTQLNEFCQKLALQRAPLSGWVLIEPESYQS